MKRSNLRSLLLGLVAIFSSIAVITLNCISVASATELGEEGLCDSACQQEAQQGLFLCQQLENAVNSDPNNPNLRIGYNNCLLAIQKQGLCMTLGITRMDFDPRDCNVHLSDFYLQESQRW